MAVRASKRYTKFFLKVGAGRGGNVRGFSTSHWFSWETALVTLGITGLIIYFFRKIRQFLKKNGRRIIDAAFRILNRVATRSLSAWLSMQQYCTSQLSDESARYLQVPGYRGASLDVDKVFVPLTLEMGGRDLTFSSTNFLDAGKRLLIVGDPGCGKSTLIKNVFRETCRDTQHNPRKGALPVRVELKRLTPPDFANDRDAGEWFVSQIKESVANIEGFEMSTLFDAWASDTGLLVLLDGLDEVASDRYPLIVVALRGLSHVLAGLSSKNTIAVSMRRQFHQLVRNDLVDDYPQSLYIRSFLPNEIYTFLNRWPFDRNREEQIDKIYTALTDRPTLREMCSNPLVLAMYVQNYYESSVGDVPDNRTQFYDKVVNELLFRRGRRQKVNRSRFVSLRDEREAILGQLAFGNLIDVNQPANSIPWRTAVTVGRRVWKCSESEAEDRLRELSYQTGIITEERIGETLHFIHLTFCEFLAASECARGRKDGWITLLDAHRRFVESSEPQLQSRLVEVLPFAHALLPRMNRPEALTDIARLNDRLVLGRCFLETQLYGEPEWSIYLKNERDFLTWEGKRDWNDALLRRLHLFSVVVREARDWFEQITRTSSEELDQVFSIIVGGSRHALAAVFVPYASQDAAAAIRLADDVGVDMVTEHPDLLVKSCQEETFLALALDKIVNNKEDAWTTILIEAALRYTNVAYRLDSMPAKAAIGLRTPGKRIARILRLGLVETGSWYSSLLGHVLTGPESMTAIELLKTFIRNSASIYWIRKLRWLPQVILLLAVSFPGILFFNLSSLVNFSSKASFNIWGFLYVGFLFTFIMNAARSIFSNLGWTRAVPVTIFNFTEGSYTEIDNADRFMCRKFSRAAWDSMVALTDLRKSES